MKKILITGASEGIGEAVAHLLASKGHQITLVARTASRLSEVVSKLPGKGHDFITADLSNFSDVSQFETVFKEKSYDVLINNAGYGIYGNFHLISLEEQLNMMHLNMDALTVLCHYFLQNTKAGDAIINVASFLGHSSYPGGTVYAATKAFVINFSEGLWYEWKDKGVFINAFCPGSTITRFHKVAGKELETSRNRSQTAEEVAAELVQTLENRSEPMEVSGFVNRTMVFLSKRLMTNKMRVKMMGKFSPLK